MKSKVFVVVMMVFLGAIPRVINYQGKLLNSSGVGINDTVFMVFRLYTSEEGGSPLWVDTLSEVFVNRGLFSVELSDFPDSIAFGDGYFLEVEVNGEVFSPRERLVASPYSMRARTVERAVQAVMRRGGTVAHTGTLVLAEGSGVTITEAGDSIFLFFTSEGGGGGGGVPLPGFSFGNPFNVACLPVEATIRPGLKVYSIVTAVLADSSFSRYVRFTAVGLPRGASALFTPDSVLPTNSANMVITTSDTTPVGSYPITIYGYSSDGSVARTVFTLNLLFETYTWTQTKTADFEENANQNVQTTGDMVYLARFDLGDGSDGDFIVSNSITLPARTYNFRNFRILPGVTVTAERGTSTPLIINCLGDVEISGWLDVSGANGGSYSGSTGGSGGLGGPGGYAGGRGGDRYNNGANGSGPGAGGGGQISGYSGYGGGGGGYGTAGGGGTTPYGSPGPTYGNPQITTLYGGSGGGGGAGGNTSGDYGGGGGGGGGGVVVINAQRITINSGGGIRANGGNGGYGGCYNYYAGGGGGGSGGAIWLRAEKIVNTGTIEANGGSRGSACISTYYGFNGGYGRIRMDCLWYIFRDILYTTSGTISPGIGWNEYPNTYLSSGTTITYLISPPGIRRWGVLRYTRDLSMAGTNLVVDVLDEDDNVLISNVYSGTDLHLAGVDASTYPGIKLRATLTTTNPLNTPKLMEWSLTYEATP